MNTIDLDMVVIGRYNPSVRGRSASYIYLGEKYLANRGLLPSSSVGALVKAKMSEGEEPHLVGEVYIRPGGVGSPMPQGLNSFIRENKDRIVILVTKQGMFFMDREEALELGKEMGLAA